MVRTGKYDNFDKHAVNYRNIHNENIKISGVDSDYFCKHKVEEVKKYENNTSKKILDLGCGDGVIVKHFSNIFSRSEIFGIDISKDSIDIAKNKKIKKSFFKVFDGKNIPYKKNTFDIGFISCVLHHIEHKEHYDILKEIKRVLNKEGRIYIFEHNPLNPITVNLVNNCEFDDDAVLMKSSHIVKILKNCGYKNIKVRYVIFFPRKSIFKKLLFLEKYLTWIPFGGQYYVSAKK